MAIEALVGPALAVLAVPEHTHGHTRAQQQRLHIREASRQNHGVSALEGRSQSF